MRGKKKESLWDEDIVLGIVSGIVLCPEGFFWLPSIVSDIGVFSVVITLVVVALLVLISCIILLVLVILVVIIIMWVSN